MNAWKSINWDELSRFDMHKGGRGLWMVSDRRLR